MLEQLNMNLLMQGVSVLVICNIKNVFRFFWSLKVDGRRAVRSAWYWPLAGASYVLNFHFTLTEPFSAAQSAWGSCLNTDTYASATCSYISFVNLFPDVIFSLFVFLCYRVWHNITHLAIGFPYSVLQRLIDYIRKKTLKHKATIK